MTTLTLIVGLDPPEQCPPGALAGRHILGRGDMQPAFAGRHIGDVGEPVFIRPDGVEMSSRKIGHDRMVVTAVRRHRQSALLGWHDQTLLTYQSGAPLSANATTPGVQFGMDTRTAIGLAALLEDLLDLGHQHRLILRTTGGTTTEPGVKRARRDTDQPAQRLQ